MKKQTKIYFSRRLVSKTKRRFQHFRILHYYINILNRALCTIVGADGTIPDDAVPFRPLKSICDKLLQTLYTPDRHEMFESTQDISRP